MNDPSKNIPKELKPRVAQLVTSARNLDIKPALRLKYARMFVAAEAMVADLEARLQSIRNQVAIIAAFEHGILEDDPEKARAAYARARQAQQEIHTSATHLSARLTKFEGLIKGGHGLLRTDVAAEFALADIISATAFIRRLAAATKPNPANLAEVKFTKSEFHRTVAGHTFFWWRTLVPQDQRRWKEMHALALCWRLTDVQDSGDFRRMVLKLKPFQVLGVTFRTRCPPWATP